MVIKIGVTVVVVLALFLIYVATRDGHFRYERSGLINAKAEVIYPYLSDFKLAQQWSPYEKDPDTKRTLGGTENQPGSFEDFESKKSGSGRLTILSVIPNQQVDLQLLMTAPFSADNKVIYKLAPEGNATRFTWVMEGNGGFMGKLMGVVMNIEKMLEGKFDEGIADLKKLIEAKGK